MRRLLIPFAFPVVAFLIVAFPVRAQDASEITLDRLFSTGEFAADRFGPARWLADGSGYTTLEASSGGGLDIVRYDPATGASEILVPSSSLVPAGSTEPLLVEGYSWSADDSKLLVFTNTRRVWRVNTKGDYWVLDRASGTLQQVGKDRPEATLMFAKFSPDADRVAYVSQNNLYLEDLATGDVTALTTDGTREIINGTFDWVYEEEFFLQDGFRWSPDGSQIAYWQLDASGIGEFLMINNTDSLYSFTIPLQYPKAGTRNSAGRIGVVGAEGGETTWVRVEGDPRENYLARMEWADDSDELIIQYLNRPQNTNRVLLATAATGEVRTVFVERDDAYLDTVDDLIWLDEGRRFTWVSERDGYRHVYIADRASGELELVTDGDYEIDRVAKIDPAGGYLYFIGSMDTATQRYLYRVPLSGGDPEALTPADEKGWHAYQISSDARWAIHTHSDQYTPPTIDLVSLPDHRVARTLVDNERLKATVSGLTRGPADFFQVETAEGVTLDGWIIKPSDFDASQRYPIFFYVYGEPWSQTVVDRWGGARHLWHHLIAEEGYVVISVDGRGTPGPRNRAWRKSIYGDVGTIASIDQAGALEVISTWPYVDTSRVGIWGWSGGGSMTLNMLFRYPDKYHVGMSVAPVPDQRFYDTIYQERYSGHPVTNAAGYRSGSPITYAENLQGDLLLVHGTGDDNVHYQGTETLINKLIAHNKPFTMMAYPNRSHGIFEGAGTTRHLYELLTRYLTTHLTPGPEKEAMQR